MPLDWPVVQGRIRIARESVNQERKRHNHQWIELESANYIAMKQSVEAARAAATGTSEPGKRSKWACGKEARPARIEDEKIAGPERQC